MILCLQTLLMPFAGVWRRLLRYSSPRKRISPFSVFSTAASETTFQPGGETLRGMGLKVVSLAAVEKTEIGEIRVLGEE